MKQYCITGISKLTRKREVVTVPCSLSNAVSILKREKAKTSRNRVYTHLKIQLYPPPVELELHFKD